MSLLAFWCGVPSGAKREHYFRIANAPGLNAEPCSGQILLGTEVFRIDPDQPHIEAWAFHGDKNLQQVIEAAPLSAIALDGLRLVNLR